MPFLQQKERSEPNSKYKVKAQMITIVDYGMGNLRSVQKALELYYPEVQISSTRDSIEKADALVLPGVGAFGDAISELKERTLLQCLKKQILCKPTLGICLGMQLLFDRSEESPGIQGLGVIEGKHLGDELRDAETAFGACGFLVKEDFS